MRELARRYVALATASLVFAAGLPAPADSFGSRLDRGRRVGPETSDQDLRLEALRRRCRADLIALGVGRAEVEALLPEGCDDARIAAGRRRAGALATEFPGGPPSARGLVDSVLAAAARRERLRAAVLALGESPERVDPVLDRLTAGEVRLALAELGGGRLAEGGQEAGAGILLVGLIFLIPPLTPIGVALIIAGLFVMLIESDPSSESVDPGPPAGGGGSSGGGYVEPPPPPPPPAESPFESWYVPNHGEPEVVVVNHAEVPLHLQIDGWAWDIGAGQSITVRIPAGSYSFHASAPGVLPASGSDTFLFDYVYQWDFYVEYR